MTRSLFIIITILFFTRPCMAAGPLDGSDAEAYFTQFSWIKAWAPRTQPIDIGMLKTWETHFPSATCTWRTEPMSDDASATRIFSRCPAYAGSRQLSFEFKAKAGDPDVYLTKVSIDGQELLVETYESFIENPFKSYGSYQSILNEPGNIQVGAPSKLVTVMPFKRLFEISEQNQYTCSAFDQSLAQHLTVYCKVDAHDPEEAAYADAHRPFIVNFERSADAWMLRGILTERANNLQGADAVKFIFREFKLPRR